MVPFSFPIYTHYKRFLFWLGFDHFSLDDPVQPDIHPLATDQKGHPVKSGVAIGWIVSIYYCLVRPILLYVPGPCKLTGGPCILEREHPNRLAISTQQGRYLYCIRIPHATCREWASSHHRDIGLDCDGLWYPFPHHVRGRS